jgi:alanine-alpha-ketoisovalerate/valine-pyruvate aminotransferase
MTIAKKIETIMADASWIRRMFEEGAELKKKYGPASVYDFSLGNPNLPPPGKFNEVLQELVRSAPPSAHAYMPNTGYPEVCAAVAGFLASEQGAAVESTDVIMTCGAAGALNIALKAMLDPGDEVLTPVPCFVEYGFYADNHGGVLKTVPSRTDFQLDLPALAAAITPKTKAVLINSPNNPTGAVYSAESLGALGELLDLRRTLPQGGLRRYQGSEHLQSLPREPHRHLLFQRYFHSGGAYRFCGGQPRGDPPQSVAGGHGAGEPYFGLRERPGPDAAGGRLPAG